MIEYQPGDILFDTFRIECLLGMGTFGQVYLVRNLKLDDLRTLKIFRNDGPGIGSSDIRDCRERFMLEAKLAARRSDFLIQVYSRHEDVNTLALEMEYASGGSLKERLQTLKENNCLMLLDECLAVTTDIARGLKSLHERDIVHRDLKPGNILFDEHGRAKISDLGLAQTDLSTSRLVSGSQAKDYPGTPADMSPEHIHPENYPHLTPASDVYALGCVLFEMLTGSVYKNQRPGTPIAQFRKDVPPWLDGLLARMLDKEPEKRPWNGGEVLVEFEKGAARERKLTQDKARQVETRATFAGQPNTEKLTSSLSNKSPASRKGIMGLVGILGVLLGMAALLLLGGMWAAGRMIVYAPTQIPTTIPMDVPAPSQSVTITTGPTLVPSTSQTATVAIEPTLTPSPAGLNSNFIPNVPLLISPSDQAALAYKSNLILSWKGVPGAVEYSVQVFGTEAIDSGWISGTSFTLKDLQPGTYSWKVKARNIEGLETGWSEVWSFNVILNPGTPQLITPVDNSQLGDSIVSLSWKADAATEYLAELYTGSDVVGAPYKTLYWSKERTWNITGLPLGTYTWRVKARNGMCQ